MTNKLGWMLTTVIGDYPPKDMNIMIITMIIMMNESLIRRLRIMKIRMRMRMRRKIMMIKGIIFI